MTVQQLIQLYAPLAGLLAVTFWLGVLSSRVLTLEREERDRKERERLELSDRDRIVRMETIIEEMGRKLEKLDSLERELASVHRLIANLAAGKGNRAFKITENEG